MRARDWLRHNRPDLNVGTRGPLKPEAKAAYLEALSTTPRKDWLEQAALDSSTAVE